MARTAVFKSNLKLKPKVVSLFRTDIIEAEIVRVVTLAVNETIHDARDMARREVPVRKVFRYGRKNVGSRLFAEQRIQGRQETRQMNLEEALAESLLRRRLGLPSAFAQTSTGKRVLGSQPKVVTSDFGSYRSKNRANPTLADDSRRDIARIGGVNRIVEIQETPDKIDAYGRSIPQPSRLVVREDIESDLSVEGRRELARADGPTLGGALKKSIMEVPAVAGRRKIKGKVVAGSDEVNYAKYVEFGTRRSRAQPFLRPALAQAREDLPRHVLDHLRRLKG